MSAGRQNFFPKRGRKVSPATAKYRATNDELSTANQELAAANEESHVANEKLSVACSELQLRVDERTGELQESRAQLRSLANALSLAEENERRQLATELHDEIGQNLALAKIKLEDACCARRSVGRAQSVREVNALMDQIIEEVRSLTFQICPPLLYQVGFAAAVEWLAEHFQDKHRLRVVVNNANSPQTLGDQLRSTLYHVVRELLLNVVKHAHAETVSISLGGDPDTMEIVVADSGSGFEVPASPPKTCGFGLFNIGQRLRHLGGTLQIESRPGAGTRVTLTVPLTRPFLGPGTAI